MKKNKKGKSSIVRRMIWAVVLGFMCGILMIILRENSTGDLSNAWKFVDALLFQDITTTKGIEGIGLFYIVGQIFMRGLQLAIVPLVLTSLSLALCSLADPKKLGRIAIKTFITYLCFYLAAATLAGVAAYGVKLTGGFDVVLPSTQAAEIATMEGYNPLVTIVNAVPNNIFSAFTSNNAILSVVVTALILGLCMTYLKDKAEPLKQVIDNMK